VHKTCRLSKQKNGNGSTKHTQAMGKSGLLDFKMMKGVQFQKKSPESQLLKKRGQVYTVEGLMELVKGERKPGERLGVVAARDTEKGSRKNNLGRGRNRCHHCHA